MLKDQRKIAEDMNDRLGVLRDLAESKSDQECFRYLSATDSTLDKQRIEETKGGLLRASYEWIMESAELLSWQETGGLLWIYGEPGKGKTMLMCGLIDELEIPIYFFCDARNTRNNSAIAALRGLIYSIVKCHSEVLKPL